MNSNQNPVQRFGCALKRFLTHPLTTGLIGLAFVICGVDDAIEAYAATGKAFDPGVHHVAILFGVAQMLKALGDICDGLKELKQTVPEIV